MQATKQDKTGRVHLDKLPTDETGGLTADEGRERFAHLAGELDRLQTLMYAAGQNGLLVVLQGRDTAGKDGTLKAVAGAMNPVGVRVASFKAPTPDELAHDFLWRVHQQTPGRGQAVFFNRSHYEDVLVARVHKLVPDTVWEARYKDINHFEELLTDNNIIVAKFYLHISKAEQKKRLLDREAMPEVAWKLNPGDWAERDYWDDYTAAYEDALGKCATASAPWYLVPADHKWFRNLAVAEALVAALHPYEKAWTAHLDEIGKTQRAALATMRETAKRG